MRATSWPDEGASLAPWSFDCQCRCHVGSAPRHTEPDAERRSPEDPRPHRRARGGQPRAPGRAPLAHRELRGPQGVLGRARRLSLAVARRPVEERALRELRPLPRPRDAEPGRRPGSLPLVRRDRAALGDVLLPRARHDRGPPRQGVGGSRSRRGADGRDRRSRRPGAPRGAPHGVQARSRRLADSAHRRDGRDEAARAGRPGPHRDRPDPLAAPGRAEGEGDPGRAPGGDRELPGERDLRDGDSRRQGLLAVRGQGPRRDPGDQRRLLPLGAPRRRLRLLAQARRHAPRGRDPAPLGAARAPPRDAPHGRDLRPRRPRAGRGEPRARRRPVQVGRGHARAARPRPRERREARALLEELVSIRRGGRRPLALVRLHGRRGSGRDSAHERPPRPGGGGLSLLLTQAQAQEGRPRLLRPPESGDQLVPLGARPERGAHGDSDGLLHGQEAGPGGDASGRPPRAEGARRAPLPGVADASPAREDLSRGRGPRRDRLRAFCARGVDRDPAHGRPRGSLAVRARRLLRPRAARRARRGGRHLAGAHRGGDRARARVRGAARHDRLLPVLCPPEQRTHRPRLVPRSVPLGEPPPARARGAVHAPERAPHDRPRLAAAPGARAASRRGRSAAAGRGRDAASRDAAARRGRGAASRGRGAAARRRSAAASRGRGARNVAARSRGNDAAGS